MSDQPDDRADASRADASRAGEPSRARRYVPVAEVGRPHGVKGELRLKVYNQGSALLLGRPKLKLRAPDGQERDAVMASVRPANAALLVRFEGVADRDAAELLRGHQILVARDLFPALEEGEFYACDIEGAEVVLRSGEDVGRLVAIETYPTCDVLVVDRSAGGRIEVPLEDAYVASVDVAARRIELHTVEGLS